MNSTTTRQIPLLDLKAQHAGIRDEVLAAVIRVIDSQRFILGDEVTALEQEIAAYCMVKHAVGCASGSDALYLALLGLGIGTGDEVITTPYSFFATAGMIVRAGATPVFVDIEPDTFNLNVDLVASLLARRPKVRGIIPVDLFGGAADLATLEPLAREKGVALIDDAAQAIGAEHRGRRCGSFGDVTCFSFFPSKNLGGYGDGGMLTTNDPNVADRLRALRAHGARQKYMHRSEERRGGNEGGGRERADV